MARASSPRVLAAMAVVLLLLLSAAPARTASAQSSTPTLNFGVVAAVTLPRADTSEWFPPVVDPLTGDLFVVASGGGVAPERYPYPLVAISGLNDTIQWVAQAGFDPWSPSIDVGTGEVYVPNSAGDFGTAYVMVTSGSTGLPVANITTPAQTSDAIYDPDDGNMYVNDVSGISVISGATNGLVTNITPAWAGASLFDPDNGNIYGQGVWSFSHDAPETEILTAASPVTNRLLATLNFSGDYLDFGRAVMDTFNGDIYVPDETGLIVVSGASNTVVGSVSLVPVFGWGWSIAVAPNGDLFVLTQGSPETISVVSGTSNQVVASFPVGYPLFMTYDPYDQVFYTDDERNDTVTVTNATTHAVMATVSLPQDIGAQLVPPVWDAENDQLYLTGQYGPVVVISPHAPVALSSASTLAPWVYLTLGGSVGFLMGAVVTFLVPCRSRTRTLDREPAEEKLKVAGAPSDSAPPRSSSDPPP